MFKIICNQKELAKALTESQKAINQKTTMEILKNFYLEAFDNSLKVIGYNLEVSISSIIDVEVVENGKVLINSKLFSDIIKKLPEDKIEIFIESDELHINCNNSKFSLKYSKADDYPQLPEVSKEKSIQINPKLFKQMISETAFATSQDQTKPVLMGELLEIKDNNVNLVAIDGYRLAVSKNVISNDIENTSLIIPGKTLLDVSSLLNLEEDSFELGFNDKHAIFNLDKITVVSRLLDGQFIDYEKLITKEHNSTVTVNRESLSKCIERASILSNDKNNLIKFNIRDNFMQLSSNSDYGNSVEEVPVKLVGEYLDIAFNSRYLMEAIRNLDCSELTLELTTNVNPCIIRPISDNEEKDYLYLLLPVRLSSNV